MPFFSVRGEDARSAFNFLIHEVAFFRAAGVVVEVGGESFMVIVIDDILVSIDTAAVGAAVRWVVVFRFFDLGIDGAEAEGVRRSGDVGNESGIERSVSKSISSPRRWCCAMNMSAQRSNDVAQSSDE